MHAELATFRHEAVERPEELDRLHGFVGEVLLDRHRRAGVVALARERPHRGHDHMGRPPWLGRLAAAPGRSSVIQRLRIAG